MILDEDDLPLTGVRVLDLTTVIFGPYATQILGDWGADVIKVEAPGGDATRAIGPARSPDMGAMFLGSNRNKRSVVLDLKRPAAQAALVALIGAADMFVHNVRPQKIEALGFGPGRVLALNPALVYGALLGYGEGGPYSGRPAYDDVIQGAAGVAGAFMARDGEPQLFPGILADKTTGLMAASSLLAAYVRRLRTGRGGQVDCPMFETLVSYNLVEHQFGAIFEPPEGPVGYPRVTSRHRRPHRTADGFICMLPYTDRQWRDFWRIVGQPEVADDPRFVGMTARSRNIDALYAFAAPLMTARASAEWLGLLEEADIPCGPVAALDDLAGDPHLQATGFMQDFAHPTEGALRMPSPPHKLDRATPPIRRGPPRLGVDGPAVLAEAGLSAAEIAAALGLDPIDRPAA